MESATNALILAQQRELERLRTLETYVETLLPRIQVSEDGSSVTIDSNIGDWGKTGPRRHEIQRDRWQYFNGSQMCNDWSIGEESACIYNPNPHWDVRFQCQVLNDGEVRSISLIFTAKYAFYFIDRKDDLPFSCYDFICYDFNRAPNPLLSARMEEIKQTLRAQFERWYPAAILN